MGRRLVGPRVRRRRRDRLQSGRRQSRGRLRRAVEAVDSRVASKHIGLRDNVSSAGRDALSLEKRFSNRTRRRRQTGGGRNKRGFDSAASTLGSTKEFVEKSRARTRGRWFNLVRGLRQELEQDQSAAVVLDPLHALDGLAALDELRHLGPRFSTA